MKKLAMATGLTAAVMLAGCTGPDANTAVGSYEATGIVTSVDDDHITLDNMQISNAKGDVDTSITSVTAIDSYKNMSCITEETPAHLENLIASGNLAVNQTVHVHITESEVKKHCLPGSGAGYYGYEPLVTAVTAG
jgi:hypothetical protein